MSMPHVCRCAICQRTMTGWPHVSVPDEIFGDPRLSAAQGPGIPSTHLWCSKHGAILYGTSCLTCKRESENGRGDV